MQSDSTINANVYKSYKSRAFLTSQDGGKCIHAKYAARLAVEKKRWNFGCRLPKIKTKLEAEEVRPERNNDKKVPSCFSYLQDDISRYDYNNVTVNQTLKAYLWTEGQHLLNPHRQSVLPVEFPCSDDIVKGTYLLSEGKVLHHLGSITTAKFENIFIPGCYLKLLHNHFSSCTWYTPHMTMVSPQKPTCELAQNLKADAEEEADMIRTGNFEKYFPFWEQAQLNRKLSVPLSYFVELFRNQPLNGLCYGCDRKLQKHFHHEKPVRIGGGYTYFSKEACARATCRCPAVSLETDGIPEDDLSSWTLPMKRLLSLAAETDLLQHMKRLASRTMVHKTQDQLSLELLKVFLEYDCGLKLQQECITEGPNVIDVPWRSLTDPSQPLNPQHIQPAENSTLLLMLCRSCQLRGIDPKTVMEFLRNTLLNKWPDGEKVTPETSIKEQPIDDGWFVFRRILLPKPLQKNVDKDDGRFEQSRFKHLKKTEEQDVKEKKDKVMHVFNSIMMLPKLLREEEEKMLLQSLKNMSRTERTEYLTQHGFLKDIHHSPFIPGLSERPRGLWTAPKAFTVHHKKIFTRPMSPFSNDRVYDIQSLKANFQVQKSDKELTQFIKVQLSQMPSESSPSPKMKTADESKRLPARIQPISHPHHEKSLVPVVEPLENQEAKNSDVGSDTWPGRKGSSAWRNSSQAKGRKPSRPDMDTETPEKMNHLQELYPTSPSNFKTGFEDDNQMSRDLSEETSLLPTVSLQSTAHYEKQPNITKYHPKGHSYNLSSCGLKTMQTEKSENITDTKKVKCPLASFDHMENKVLHEREPESLVHLVTSTERTKSHSVQLVTSRPDGLEENKNEWQQHIGKPLHCVDDRQISEKAPEAIVSGKEERERLPRAVFTKRKPLPSIKKGSQRNSQKAKVVMEETQRRRPNIPDFLTKYCIINPGRLSFYERIFLKYCNHEDTEDQAPTDTLNTNVNCVPDGFDHIEEILIQKKAKGNVDIGRKTQQILESGSVSDQLEKTQFKIKKLSERKKTILSTIQEFQDQRMVLQATQTKQQDHTAEQETKKKKRNGKKDAKPVLNMEEKENTYEIPSSVLSSVPSGDPTKQADEYTELECLDVKIKLLWRKHEDITSRLSELCETRQILEQKNRKASLEAIDQNSKISPEKRRLQSAIFCRLHPNKDPELDISDLQEALQDVNKCLVSPKEFSYIFHILELPGQYRLNLELFCIVAALSEKVTQLDPVIKRLINKLDFEALSIRIEKAKELWHLLQESEGEKERQTNRKARGSVSIRSLALELAAGGYSLEAINFALQKFNRTEAGVLSFMDFVTYIPLFVEIHEGIVQDPLSIIPNTIPYLEGDLHIAVNQSIEQVP